MVVRASFSKLTAGNRIEQVGRQELFPAAFLFSALIKKRKVWPTRPPCGGDQQMTFQEVSRWQADFLDVKVWWEWKRLSEALWHQPFMPSVEMKKLSMFAWVFKERVKVYFVVALDWWFHLVRELGFFAAWFAWSRHIETYLCVLQSYMNVILRVSEQKQNKDLFWKSFCPKVMFHNNISVLRNPDYLPRTSWRPFFDRCFFQAWFTSLQGP